MSKADFTPRSYDERFRDVVGQEVPPANLSTHGTSEIPETWDSGLWPGTRWDYSAAGSAGTWNGGNHPNVYLNTCFDTPKVKATAAYMAHDGYLPGCYYRQLQINDTGPWPFSEGTWGYKSQHKASFSWKPDCREVYTTLRAQGWPLDWFTLCVWTRPMHAQDERHLFK